jgi:hypothetical protein
MKILSTWTKENALTKTYGGDFIESSDEECLIGDEGQYLIKFPKLKNDVFFRLLSIWGPTIDFVSDEALHEGYKIYYQIDQYDEAFDEEFPIDVYDNDKNLIRHIKVKDLYDPDYSLSLEFFKAVNGQFIRRTITERNGRQLSSIIKIDNYEKYNDILKGNKIAVSMHNADHVWDSNISSHDFDYFDIKIEVLDKSEAFEIFDNLFK